MKSSAKKIELASVDDLFTTEQERQQAGEERVVRIPLSQLHYFKGYSAMQTEVPFTGQPYRVKDDDPKMLETLDSVRQRGVRTPGLVRPDPEGGYEIISGHRRHRASELAGLEDTPYLTVRRAWHTESNRPVILDELKTKAAERNIPLPICLADCLREAKANSTSEYVVPNRDGDPLSYTQFKRLWQYIVTRTVKERSYYRYEDGKRVRHTVTPVLGEKAAHNGKVVYSLDFEVTPHQLRHTYITNLIHSSVDPKTVQYLAGHESSKITMDIYAKVKYNRPDELVKSMGGAFAQWDGVRS